MEINIRTGQDILRDIAIQYVNKAFVYITDCNPPLMKILKRNSSCSRHIKEKLNIRPNKRAMFH